MKSGRKSIRKNLENKIRMKTIGRKIHRIRSKNVNKLMMENYQSMNDGKMMNSTYLKNLMTTET